jgi:putative transport protein
MIVIGVLIRLTTALVAYVVRRRVLGMNPALFLGSITGAMTNTPTLNVVTETGRSSVPALGYGGTYTLTPLLTSCSLSRVPS